MTAAEMFMAERMSMQYRQERIHEAERDRLARAFGSGNPRLAFRALVSLVMALVLAR